MAQQDTLTHIAVDDLVKPLVAEAVRLYQEVLEAEDDAHSRRVNPRRSPAVSRANARLNGACTVLARMWQLLGMDPAAMDPGKARQVVIAEHGAANTAPAEVPAEPEQPRGAATAEEAKTSEPVIHIDITGTGSALGYVRNMPVDQDWSVYGNQDVYTGHWTVWSDAHGSATGSSLGVAVNRWAKQYGFTHGRATGENEPTGKKLDFAW